jgi:hypothetical protein
MPNHNLRGDYMRLITIVLLASLSLFANIVYAATVVDANSKNAIAGSYLITTKMGPVPADTIPAKAAPFLAQPPRRHFRNDRYNHRWRQVRPLPLPPSCTGPMSVTAYPGSLRNNIAHIAGRCGWQTVWNPPYDYRWYGKTRISGMDLNDVFRKMLVNYPVQAIFYRGNRILAIEPRNLPPRNLP